MKPLYLLTLTLILTLGNCITTTSYYPEGIENKPVTTVDKSKLARPRVNLEVNGDWFIFHRSSRYKYSNIFLHDPSSPIVLRVTHSIDRTSLWRFLMSLFLPTFASSSGIESVQYGRKDQIVTKNFEITRRVYLPIPYLSFFGFISSYTSQDNNIYSPNLDTIHNAFVLNLREEIAKIAPFADPESDTPQTVDLPTTFNDIVVLRNGEILEGVHTKVTPTTLEVTESNGKKTIYKKSQVLSVKKK